MGSLNKEEKCTFTQNYVNVLLAEYQACQMNRDHYDNVLWTMGSIFIAAALTLLGFSFLEEVRNNLIEVGLLAVFSCLLLIIWLGYIQHATPYIETSFDRLKEIEKKLNEEKELSKRGYEIKLHTTIEEKTKGAIKGRWITGFLFHIVFVAWIFRILILLT